MAFHSAKINPWKQEEEEEEDDCGDENIVNRQAGMLWVRKSICNWDDYLSLWLRRNCGSFGGEA